MVVLGVSDLVDVKCMRCKFDVKEILSCLTVVKLLQLSSSKVRKQLKFIVESSIWCSADPKGNVTTCEWIQKKNTKNKLKTFDE
jgi:hypothetical protein